MADWWVGAYGADMEGSSEGISRATSRPDGSLELVGLAASVLSPTFLVKAHGHLYAAIEGSGTVVSYAVAGDELVLDGSASSGGQWPCQLEFIDGGVIAANYGGGELGVIALSANAAVADLTEVLTSTGSGPHEEQAGPHAHASFRVDETHVLSADLGADRLWIHEIAGVGLRRTGEAVLPAGTGPRDIARHPSGLIYVLGEHGRDVHVFEWTGEELAGVASVALPGALPNDQAAAIGFGPGGRYVYCGLRGSNTIAVLRASDDGRKLEAVGSASTEGDWPRHLVVDGDVLHVANQLSNTVASFRLGDDGMPVLIAAPTPIPSPTYLLPA